MATCDNQKDDELVRHSCASIFGRNRVRYFLRQLSLHIPEACPNIESWRLTEKCVFVYSKPDCAELSHVLTYNGSWPPQPLSPKPTMRYVLVRPGCLAHVEYTDETSISIWDIGRTVFDFETDQPYDVASCVCGSSDPKLLTCIPELKLERLDGCSDKANTICTYNVKSGVYQIGNDTEVTDEALALLVENRVGFYITFNGTDLVSTVDLVQQFTGAAVGRLSKETIGPEEHYEFWQVTYTCGGYQKYLAKVHLTVWDPQDDLRKLSKMDVFFKNRVTVTKLPTV